MTSASLWKPHRKHAEWEGCEQTQEHPQVDHHIWFNSYSFELNETKLVKIRRRNTNLGSVNK